MFDRRGMMLGSLGEFVSLQTIVRLVRMFSFPVVFLLLVCWMFGNSVVCFVWCVGVCSYGLFIVFNVFLCFGNDKTISCYIGLNDFKCVSQGF